MLSDNARKALDTVVARFTASDLSDLLQIALIARDDRDRIPSDKWSLANRVIAYIQTGELDCRGFRQWEEARRHVVKGATAAYILGPCTYTAHDDATDTDRVILRGFKSIAVFPAWATEGEPLPTFAYAPAELPPLQEAARRLGLQTAYTPGDGRAYGEFDPRANLIFLHTQDAKTWFHELAHAAHNKIEALKGGQHPRQETVAEFTACVLMELYGLGDRSGNAWSYIQHYNADPLTAIYQAIATVESVLDLLLA